MNLINTGTFLKKNPLRKMPWPSCTYLVTIQHKTELSGHMQGDSGSELAAAPHCQVTTVAGRGTGCCRREEVEGFPQPLTSQQVSLCNSEVSDKKAKCC